MENLDYEKVIDPLCIPVIKLLREKMGIKTLFCCQGRSNEDGDHDHSSRGYIAVDYTPKAYMIFRQLYEEELKRWMKPFMDDTERYPQFRRVYEGKRNRIIVYLPRMIFKREKLEKEWKWIYNFFLTHTHP